MEERFGVALRKSKPGHPSQAPKPETPRKEALEVLAKGLNPASARGEVPKEEVRCEALDVLSSGL